MNHDFTSQGTVSATTLTVSGTCTVAGGSTGASTLTATSVLVEPGGTLSGGTVASSVTNNGNVAAGSMNVTGNYSQAAGAELTENFGATLHVQGNVTLSGALKVIVNPKHPPASGVSYTALTAGSLSGSFTSVTAGFTVTTSGNTIQVTKQ